jgi:hypothetical protein
MPLKIKPQYVSQADRTVDLTLSDSFVSKHPPVRSDNVLIHNFTTRGIVFSIIHDHDEMTVFCCALQISMPPKYGQTQIEITSETEMKYFTENLSRRLPCLMYVLGNQMMFDDDAQSDHLEKNGNNLDVVILTRNLFMVMFDSTIYFFQIDFEDEVVCSKLPLWKLNQTTYKDSDKGIPDLSCCFDSFRFHMGLEVYNDHVNFDVYSNVFNLGNYCVCASLTIYFDNDDDTLLSRVVCSRRLIERGVDDSLCSSTPEPDFEKTDFSDKRLKILDENSEEDSDEEDSDEEKEDPTSVVETTDGNRIYVFAMLDDIDSYCILFLKGAVSLLQVDRDDRRRLESSNSEELITVFERDSVDFSERLEGFGEVDLLCRIVIADPIQITCNFEDSFGRIVLTKQLIVENDEFRET